MNPLFYSLVECVNMSEFEYASSKSALKRIECDFRAICHSRNWVGCRCRRTFCRLHESDCIPTISFRNKSIVTCGWTYKISILHILRKWIEFHLWIELSVEEPRNVKSRAQKAKERRIETMNIFRRNDFRWWI